MFWHRLYITIAARSKFEALEYIYIYSVNGQQVIIETNFIKFKMTSFFCYFQMESFQFSKFRFHSKGRSFQYASGEPRTNKNTSS